MLRKYFLITDDFLRIMKTIFLGITKKILLLLEYLTKESVNKDIDKTSTNLDNEYINGIKE